MRIKCSWAILHGSLLGLWQVKLPRVVGRDLRLGRLDRVRPMFFEGKAVPEKALTMSGADRFSRRGGTGRLHAILMNQLCTIWGYRQKLSSGSLPSPPASSR